MEVGQGVSTFCNHCGDTWHNVLHIAKQRYDEHGYFEECTYYMLQRGGCHSVKLREDWHEGAHGCETTRYYPPPSRRKEPKSMAKWWLYSPLPQVENSVLLICTEVYRALQNEQPHLAAMV